MAVRPPELLIVGAGGFARETAAAVRAVNEAAPGTVGGTGGPGPAGAEGDPVEPGAAFRLLGFLDDNPALHGTQRAGLTILGGLSMVDDFTDAVVVVCVGNPRDYSARARVVDRLALPTRRYASVVHPSASVGAGCALGPGTVLLAHTVLTADVSVGAHVSVMPHAVLTHDDLVGDFVTIASGVRLGGGVRLDPGAYVGAGALIREGVRIGAGALIGMGSVVLRDVPAQEVWAGNPARRLRARQAGTEVFANMGSG
ncbi:acetyltransferase [Rugosimonospora acidiphila]|uniref:acetyltransferase n=1 Tax=Rugosimonospora acidiphila TaxID=556531 RepID=UPI0031EB37BB